MTACVLRRNVVPVMAIGVAELKRELKAAGGLTEFPEIHQFLDGFYLSRIGIRILIGQHIALHEPQKENHIGARECCFSAPFALQQHSIENFQCTLSAMDTLQTSPGDVTPGVLMLVVCKSAICARLCL